MASELLKLTVQLVASHASVSELSPTELIDEVKAIYQTLTGLDAGKGEGEAVAALKEEEGAPVLKPAVPIEESIQEDYIHCLVCGTKFRTLKAHLRRAHGLTPAEYYQRFGLDPKTYPLVSKKYSEQRRKLAKEKGLGEFRRRKAKE